MFHVLFLRLFRLKPRSEAQDRSEAGEKEQEVDNPDVQLVIMLSFHT